jgi:CRP/FNR family cyclic AMP-dependent transcriptional regulator
VERFWHLKNCDLFKRLTPPQIARLEKRARFKRFERGNLIYLPSDQSDSVLFLESGRVKMYHVTPDGKQTLLAFIEPGELFGELAAVFPGQREEYAETMAASDVILIPGDEMQQLMEEHAELSLGITKLISLRRRRIERRLKSLLYRTAKDRLVHLLLELAEDYGRRTNEGVLLNVKLSHQDLSSVIGSTRETVTNVISELEQEGRIVVRRRQFILLNMSQLAESIDAPLPQLKVASPA